MVYNHRAESKNLQMTDIPPLVDELRVLSHFSQFMFSFLSMMNFFFGSTTNWRPMQICILQLVIRNKAISIQKELSTYLTHDIDWWPQRRWGRWFYNQYINSIHRSISFLSQTLELWGGCQRFAVWVWGDFLCSFSGFPKFCCNFSVFAEFSYVPETTSPNDISSSLLYRRFSTFPWMWALFGALVYPPEEPVWPLVAASLSYQWQQDPV